MVPKELPQLQSIAATGLSKTQRADMFIQKIKGIQRTLLKQIPTKQQLFVIYHLIIN